MAPDIKDAVWPGWETVKVLGQGSFGAVYEIRRTVFEEEERAALKVISIPQSSSEIDEMYSEGYDDASIQTSLESQLHSIVSEYSLMRKLNGCANVVHCDDVRFEKKQNEIGWNIYIKMELLNPFMKSLPTPITEDIAIRVGMDMCRALERCAMHNIIHRDIKPQNMFVSDGGDYKLGDFGIAKTVEKTSGGTKIGTFKYMAPEVYNNQPYGASADICSLGLVLYWLLNERRMPFVPLPPAPVLAGVDGEAANRRMRGEPIPPPKNGSPELQRIVLKACAFDPKDRYETPMQMHMELEELDHYLHYEHTFVPTRSLESKPEPVDAPVQKAESASAPIPTPIPVPAQKPEPSPSQIPQPVPTPTPLQKPEPAPVPKVVPASMDTDYTDRVRPASQSEPVPQPIPRPAPQPAPRPAPQPAPRPAPQPAPRPAPQPAPRPAPQPAPRPVPQPAPKSAPKKKKGKPGLMVAAILCMLVSFALIGYALVSILMPKESDNNSKAAFAAPVTCCISQDNNQQIIK